MAKNDNKKQISDNKDVSTLVQAGFDRKNYSKSGLDNKWFVLIAVSIMTIIMFVSVEISTNLILKAKGFLDSDTSFMFFNFEELGQVFSLLWNEDVTMKMSLVQYYLLPFGVELLLTTIFIRIAMNSMKSSKPSGDRHGTARFATSEEIKASGLVVENIEEFFNGTDKDGHPNTGVSLGKAVIGIGKKQKTVYLIEKSQNEHVLCYAPSRSGKGIGLVVPSLLLWKDSSITLDPKGENWELTSGWLRKNGMNTVRLDLGAPYYRYNPLSELNPTKVGLSDEVRRMVGLICGDGGKGDNKFFEENAKDLLTASLTYLILTYYCPNSEQEELVNKMKQSKPNITLYDIAIYMSGIDPRTGLAWEPEKDAKGQVSVSASVKQYEELANYQKNYPHHRFMDELKDVYEQEGEYIESTGRKFLGMAREAEKTFSLVVSSADQNLAIFKLPIIKAVTGYSDFKLLDLVDPTIPATALYLVNPPKDELTGKTDGVIKIILQNLFITVLYETGLRAQFKKPEEIKNNYNGYIWSKRAVLCMLDEFPKLGKFEIMEKLLADAAGYGAKFYLISQSDKQINKAYEKENSIFAGCQHKVIFRPADSETAESLSKILGNYTYVEETFNVNSSGKSFDIIQEKSGSKNWTESSRALMSSDEITRMTDDEAIILSKSFQIFGRKLRYFQDDFLNKAVEISKKAFKDEPLIPKNMNEDESVLERKLENKGVSEGVRDNAIMYAEELKRRKEIVPIIMKKFDCSEFEAKAALIECQWDENLIKEIKKAI